MKAVIKQKELDKAIQIVNRAAANKSMIAALSGILINAETGKLILMANNHEIAIQHTVDADVDEPGKVLVSGRLLSDLVKRMPAGDVTLKYDAGGNSLNIKGTGTSYNILTMKVYDFPDFPAIETDKEDVNCFSILPAKLREIYKYTAFAVSTDAVSKPVYTGVHFLLKNQHLSALGTDTHRLALKKFDGQFGELEANIIIPTKTLAEVTMVLDPDEPVDIIWSNNKIAFTTPSTYFVSRLIIGNSPAFERIIPVDPGTVVTVNREQFLTALERLAIVSAEKHKDFFLNDTIMAVKDGVLKISGASREKGHAAEEMPADIVGEYMEIIFNGTNIAECLKVLSSDKVILSLVSPKRPAMLVADNDNNFLYVFSPIVRQVPEMEAAS